MKEPDFYRWHDEPGTLRIKLKKGYLKDLTERAIKKAGTIQKLSEETNISKATIHNYKNEISLTISGIKKILNYNNIKYNRINHKIKFVGWNKPIPNFKLSSKEIAIILAASLADGHINNSHFMYKNKNLELIEKIKDCIKKLYGNEIKINDRIARNGIPYILCPSIVKRQLERLGSPKGKKLFQNPSVPEIIKKGGKEQKISFIQQFFDDEGCAEKESIKISCSQCSNTTDTIPTKFKNKMILKKSIYLTKIPTIIKKQIIKPNLLVDIQKILRYDFQIDTNLRFKKMTKYKTRKGKEYISATWELNSAKQESIKKFYNKIGFFSSKKQKILKEILQPTTIPNKINFRLLNLAIKLHKELGKFRVKDIQKEIKIRRGPIRKRLDTLVKHKILSNDKGKYKVNLEI